MNAATNDLLDETNDLSVHQLSAYHTVMTVFRLVSTGQPEHLAGKLQLNRPYQRQDFP